MIENPKNLTEQLLNLSERVATEMRVLNRTKVSTINGQVPDANGNVTIEVSGGGGSGDAIPKTGDRGLLAGYETSECDADSASVTINANSTDVMSLSFVSEITIENGTIGVTDDSGLPATGFNQTWTKVALFISFMAPVITLGDSWRWAGGEAPTIDAGGVLVLHWNGVFGIASYISI